MYEHRKRTGHIFSIEDGEASITILRPISGEYLHNGSYLVVYEDAHGTIEIEVLQKDEIASKYSVDQRDLEDV